MFFKHNVIGLFWALFILILCGIPGDQFPSSGVFDGFDKILHGYLFAQLGLLQIVGFKKQYQYRILQNNAIRYSFYFGFSYGLLTELLQFFIFTNRAFENDDLIADFTGTAIGVVLFYIIYKVPYRT